MSDAVAIPAATRPSSLIVSRQAGRWVVRHKGRVVTKARSIRQILDECPERQERIARLTERIQRELKLLGDGE